ncbi:multidrug efflux pump-associated protein, AcrZ family [Arsenophonus sp. ENCA]|nr:MULTISPECIES: AcrZ family multidrug efflux pump-associated protein [Arsenophonus]MDR5609088.1 AcrZ family multidrug efflux pump-associated protein [Arsenophonus sp.]MDR5613833.1 AcrZ family multidrug efflux pump-associated protein [Arsenophonus sp.]PAV10019.1 multidrug efflux pump-associated protein, AcrZ family [Arsenophonus sp. ENCA]SPP31003.1 Multidrug efflux pump accessory protein AcrZ [Arsenophonus endosymbiont of Aleurodicus floccissimus]
MLEILKSMLFALCMVPIVMGGIMLLIYGIGELFNILSKAQFRHSKKQH